MTTRVAMATIVAALATFLAVAPCGADEDATQTLLPTGFTAHKRPVQSGEVDWAAGEIIAEGLGKAEGRSARQMARRGATVVAVRNAMAIALGIQIDADGTFQNIQNGEVHLKGVVKGHKVVSTEWFPDRQPPECIVRVSVPLWGIEGVSSVVYAVTGGRRLPLTVKRADVSNVVLVIDARGTPLDPCLFPVVSADGGGVLYDVASLSKLGRAAPPVRYVETEMTHEQLQAWAKPVETNLWHRRLAGGVTAGITGETPVPQFSSRTVRILGIVGSDDALPSWGAYCMASPELAPKPASQPTSKPTSQPIRKPRRRRVVKAIRTTSKDRSKIVLTQEDADRLRNSAEGTSLLRSGQVIVVVDAVAAGIQGRIEPVERSRQFALAAGP